MFSNASLAGYKQTNATTSETDSVTDSVTVNEATNEVDNEVTNEEIVLEGESEEILSCETFSMSASGWEYGKDIYGEDLNGNYACVSSMEVSANNNSATSTSATVETNNSTSATAQTEASSVKK